MARMALSGVLVLSGLLGSSLGCGEDSAGGGAGVSGGASGGVAGSMAPGGSGGAVPDAAAGGTGGASSGGTGAGVGGVATGGSGGDEPTAGAAGSTSAGGAGPVLPSTEPPGGLLAAEVPQFVVFGNDDNAFTGFDAEGGVQFLLDLFDGRTNPAGNGHAGTFDGAPVRFSLFGISTYLDSEAKDPPEQVKTVWRAAYDAGHEIGNHTHTHPHGADYTAADWETEIATCEDWLTRPWDEADPASDSVGIGVAGSDIVGFRSPYLEYSDALFDVLLAHGIEYDCSIEEGFAADQDGTNFLWPYQLDGGSPADPRVTSHPGLWELPVYVFIVPPDEACASYGVPAGLRDSIASRMPDGREPPFDVSDGKIRGLDYDLWADFDMTAAEFVATLSYTLDLRLAGNRAPLTLGIHTDFYHPQSWGRSNMTGATDGERRQALSDVFEYALGKPEVRIVAARDLVAWLSSPAPL